MSKKRKPKNSNNNKKKAHEESQEEVKQFDEKQEEVKQFDEKPVKAIDFSLKAFILIGFIVITQYAETIKPDDINNRTIIILVANVAFGSFMKAIHTLAIGLMVGYENEQFSPTLTAFKTYVDVTTGCAIIYMLFATNVPAPLGLLLFATTIVFLALMIYSFRHRLKNKL